MGKPPMIGAWVSQILSNRLGSNRQSKVINHFDLAWWTVVVYPDDSSGLVSVIRKPRNCGLSEHDVLLDRYTPVYIFLR